MSVWEIQSFQVSPRSPSFKTSTIKIKHWLVFELESEALDHSAILTVSLVNVEQIFSLKHSNLVYFIWVFLIAFPFKWSMEVEEEVLVAQSCPTLCNPMDCSPPASSVHGILQAKILQWVAILFSRGSSQTRDRTWVSCTAGRFFIVWGTGEALVFKNTYSTKIFENMYSI